MTERKRLEVPGLRLATGFTLVHLSEDGTRYHYVELAEDVGDRRVSLEQASLRYLVPGLAQLRQIVTD